MDLEVDQALAEIAEERGELEKELEALSNEVKAAYAKASMAGGEGETAPEAVVERGVSSPSDMEVVAAGDGSIVKEQLKEGKEETR